MWQLLLRHGVACTHMCCSVGLRRMCNVSVQVVSALACAALTLTQQLCCYLTDFAGAACTSKGQVVFLQGMQDRIILQGKVQYGMDNRLCECLETRPEDREDCAAVRVAEQAAGLRGLQAFRADARVCTRRGPSWPRPGRQQHAAHRTRQMVQRCQGATISAYEPSVVVHQGHCKLTLSLGTPCLQGFGFIRGEEGGDDLFVHQVQHTRAVLQPHATSNLSAACSRWCHPVRSSAHGRIRRRGGMQRCRRA